MPVILLVSAVAEELGDLPGTALGIGHVTVAARLAALLSAEQPDGVVMIGTAGRYADGPDIGTACIGRRVGLSHGVAVMGLGYVPHPPPPIQCDPRLVGRSDLPLVDVLTVGAITTDPVLAGRLGDGWQIEQTEAYGVATACQQAGVPFAVVVGISNSAGAGAHAEWLSHRNAARAAARTAVSRLFVGAASGS